MSLQSKLRKLARMSFREVAFRAQEHIRLQKERKRYPARLSVLGQPNYNFFAREHAALFDTLQNGDLASAIYTPGFFRLLPIPLDATKAVTCKARYPQGLASSIQRADRFLNRRFAFLGIEFAYPREIPWQQDPVTGYRYPSGFYRDLDIFTNRKDLDIKQVWEINRLQFFIEIAKAWYLTGEQKYQDDLDFLVAHWYENNPYNTGVAWTSALEVGVRALSLLWTLNFYLAAKNPSAKTVLLLLKLLYLSGNHLDENLSIYFSPYNHLIGEVAALFLIGHYLPLLAGAEKWRLRGWRILETQIEKQFHPDGGSVEQATFYHHFTLGFYLQCINARRLGGDPVPPQVMARTEKALEFAMHLTRPDRTLPWIGDIDAARSLYFSYPAHWDFRGFQAIGAAWFARSDMKFVAGELGEEAFWLLPDSDVEKFALLASRRPAATTVTLPHSGYTILRGGWQEDDHFGLIDCGPIAHGVFADNTPSAAHGHADLLAVEVAPFGESLLIDPGFSNYRGELDWHSYFRSTAAHNTLEIDGESQARQVGILNWCLAPRFVPLQTFAGRFATGFCGEHFGYARLPDKPRHRRYFLFIDAAFWLIFDAVTPDAPEVTVGEHTIVHHFHFCPEARVEKATVGSDLLATGQKTRLGLYFLHTGGASRDLEVRTGGPSPADGWISPTYRQRRPASVARLGHRGKLPFYLVTLLVPSKKAADAAFTVVRQSDGFVVHGPNAEFVITLAQPEARSKDRWLLQISKKQAGTTQRLLLGNDTSSAEAETSAGGRNLPIIEEAEQKPRRDDD